MNIVKKLFHFNEGLLLESGLKLDSFDLMVETYGELNGNKSNAILVCHAFSGDHHAAGEDSETGQSGWWGSNYWS